MASPGFASNQDNVAAFFEGLMGRFGLLRRAQWGETGCSLWQWRGLWAKSRKTQLAQWCSRHLVAVVPTDKDWFYSRDHLASCLGYTEQTPAQQDLLSLAFQTEQVQACARAAWFHAYNKNHPLFWIIRARHDQLLQQVLAWSPTPAVTQLSPYCDGYTKGTSPLTHALWSGWVTGVDRLLTAGGRSVEEPLAIAAQAGSPDMVRLLLDRGADPNSRHIETRRTVLGRLARRLASQDHMVGGRYAQVIALLLQAGADLNAYDGKTVRSKRVRDLLLSATCCAGDTMIARVIKIHEDELALSGRFSPKNTGHTQPTAPGHKRL